METWDFRGTLTQIRQQNLQIDWVQAMADTPQDVIWHAEGDVWTHTLMVLEALETLPEWLALDAIVREQVLAAALLHDIAKPIVTRSESGRIVSPKHSLVGERVARELLWKGDSAIGLKPVPIAIREVICELVRHHGLPLNFQMDERSAKKIRLVSQLLPIPALHALSKADVLGRVCKDQDKAIDKVDLFAEFAKELNCWDGPFLFGSEAARYQYFRKEDADPHYTPFEAWPFEAIIMVGLPGVGKDSYIKEHLSHLPMVSLDLVRQELGIGPKDNQGRVIQAAKEMARGFMRQGISFVWNGTNVSRELRSMPLQMVAEYGGKPRLIYLETDYQTLHKQNNGRTGNARVPWKAVEKLVTRLDVPEIWEAVAVEWK